MTRRPSRSASRFGRRVSFHSEGSFHGYDQATRIMRKLTITVSEEVHLGLHTKIGARKISRFIDSLARAHVVNDDLDSGYQAMAADRQDTHAERSPRQDRLSVALSSGGNGKHSENSAAENLA